uniref:Uncharacterized protein n=1 Tax=Anguilla anguilla TaxID=7936 RepID=A0A0E9VSF1_ANGAN
MLIIKHSFLLIYFLFFLLFIYFILFLFSVSAPEKAAEI